MKIFKTKVLPYLIPFIIGLLMFLWVIISHDIFKLSDKKEIFRALSDACFIPGCIIGGFGLLILLSNEGAFDIISYGLRLFFEKFKRNINERKFESYYDYKVFKRGHKQSYGNVLAVGVFYLLFAILFLILYYN